ncbi:hypothetical protein, partial [Escherichia coli]|uniref:hypothetical protein n=1 Tax=Escherichia coli TaxID=562 RepID=UPI0020220451
MVFVWKQNYILVDEYFFFCCTWIVNSAAEKPAVANDIVKALGGNFTRHDGWFESDNAIVT